MKKGKTVDRSNKSFKSGGNKELNNNSQGHCREMPSEQSSKTGGS